MCKAFSGADFKTDDNLLLSSQKFTTSRVRKKLKPNKKERRNKKIKIMI